MEDKDKSAAPVAATVLTDERIDAIYGEAFEKNDTARNIIRATCRAIEREVLTHVMPPMRGTGSQQEATERDFDTLHNDIMNLPSYHESIKGGELRVAYKVGHRDARHAAADLVSEFASRCRGQGGVTNNESAVVTPAAAGIESLTRYDISKYPYQMDEKSKGDWVNFADVERLLATNAGVKAAEPAYDLADGISKFVELAISELFAGKEYKAIRSDLRSLGKNFNPKFWQVAAPTIPAQVPAAEEVRAAELQEVINLVAQELDGCSFSQSLARDEAGREVWRYLGNGEEVAKRVHALKDQSTQSENGGDHV